MTNEVTNQAEAQDNGAVPAPDSISFTDLNVLLQIIDLATQRGAFRGSELSQVGNTYDKVNAFLTYVNSQKPQEPEEDQPEKDEE